MDNQYIEGYLKAELNALVNIVDNTDFSVQEASQLMGVENCTYQAAEHIFQQRQFKIDKLIRRSDILPEGYYYIGTLSSLLSFSLFIDFRDRSYFKDGTYAIMLRNGKQFIINIRHIDKKNIDIANQLGFSFQIDKCHTRILAIVSKELAEFDNNNYKKGVLTWIGNNNSIDDNHSGTIRIGHNLIKPQ